jgi:hypothetical protein
MIDTLEERRTLIKMRDECLHDLVSLASRTDAAKAQEALIRLHTLISAIDRATSDSSSSGKYARHKSAISAIRSYLEEIGKPKPDEEIIKDLCDGGWRGGMRYKPVGCRTD